MHLIQVTIYTVDDRMTRSAADCRWHSSLFTYSKEGGGRAAISCSSPSCPFSPFALALYDVKMSKVRNSLTYDFDNNVQIKIQLWV